MHGEFFFGLVTFAGLIYFAGHSFIDSFFDRKEELLIKMYSNKEGEA